MTVMSTSIPQALQATLPGVSLSVLVVLLAAYFLWQAVSRPQPAVDQCKSTAGSEDSIDLSWVEPLSTFEIEATPEIQYRPFKDGKYHLTMGIGKMPEECWIELDDTYRTKMALKRRLLQTQRDMVTAFHPDGWEGSYEALQTQVDFITKRFPNLFSKTLVGVKNHILNEEWDIRRSSSLWETYHPTEVMGMLTLDDYVVMVKDKVAVPGEDAPQYRVKAGTVCFPGGWKVKDKLGLSVFSLHAGKVPDYETKIALSMNRFFERLKVQEPVQRFNYHLDPSPELFHPKSHHNTEAQPAQLEDLYFRVERQCLRRLPRTRAIVFQIRTYLYRLADMFDTTPQLMKQPNLRLDEAIARRWRASIDQLDGPLAKYKNKGVWEAAVVDALEKWLSEHEGKRVDTVAGVCTPIQLGDGSGVVNV
ncbi:hypothetical protein EDD37DRAFT_189166 [Exophiala viscosa]|uniref:uncharacterized protein n=1 Tax=Exophiala viscosa TaxID=2486360 RepID=UPI00219A7902|nr:hypothetical protein EDD37DRAFT_189166 [Exophiala viscosa]